MEITIDKIKIAEETIDKLSKNSELEAKYKFRIVSLVNELVKINEQIQKAFEKLGIPDEENNIVVPKTKQTELQNELKGLFSETIEISFTKISADDFKKIVEDTKLSVYDIQKFLPFVDGNIFE